MTISKNNKVLVFCIILLIFIIFLSIGYSAFSDQFTITNSIGIIRANVEVRVTGVTSSSPNVTNLDYNTKQITNTVTIPAGGSVTYTVTARNLGNVPVAVSGVTFTSGGNTLSGLSANITNNNYVKICNNNVCTNNALKTFDITITNNGSSLSDVDLDINLIFKEVYTVTYNNSIIGEALDGGTFEYTFTNDIPYDVSLNKNYPYEYTNNTLTVENIDDNFVVNRYYSITYVLNDSNDAIQAANQPIKYLAGSNVTILDPSRPNYTFDGWYDNNTFQGNSVTSTNGLTGNLILYAKWSSNQQSVIPITSLVEGDHIMYVDANGVDRECIILYDSTSSYGIQAITASTVGTFSIGNGTSSQSGVNRTNSTTSAINKYNTARNSYNDARSDLNEAARAYVNTDLSPANGARIVGTPPDNPDIVNSEHYHSSYTYANNSGLPGTDDYYQTDLNQMKKSNINAVEISSHYWMGSYYVGSGSSTTSFYVRVVKADDDNVSNNINGSYMNRIFTINKTLSNSNSYGGMSHGVRPVFTLRNDLYVSAGNNGIYTFVTQ